MPNPGLLLLAGLLAPAAPPPGQAVGPPRLVRGLELVYRGEVVEASDRVESRFRKRSDLEVRVLVVETGPLSADCAVMTRVLPRPDPAVAGAAAAVTGSDPSRSPAPPAVRIDLVRVDGQGRCRLLRPPPGPPPVPFGPDVPTAAVPPASPEGVPSLELGMFVPLPPGLVSLGGGWDVPDPGRPPVVWKAERETVWNGGRCVELIATQESDGWDKPGAAPTGWRRTETVLAAPVDGYAASVRRRCERRDGASISTWVEVRYDLQPPTRLLGARYTDARHDAEAAFCFAADVDPLAGRGGTHDPRPFQLKLAKIDRFLADHPTPTGFRDAVEGVRRRCLAAARGDAPPAAVVPAAAVVPVELPAVGKSAPDFAAPALDGSGTFRLSAARGKPVVVVFFKPGAGTTPGTLGVAEALQKLFADRAAVVAVAAGPAEVVKKGGLTVVDGVGVRDRYGVDTFPRFLLVDPAGSLAWQFEGFGPETGFLVKQQVERMVGGPAPTRPQPAQPVRPAGPARSDPGP